MGLNIYTVCRLQGEDIAVKEQETRENVNVSRKWGWGGLTMCFQGTREESDNQGGESPSQAQGKRASETWASLFLPSKEGKALFTLKGWKKVNQIMPRYSK